MALGAAPGLAPACLHFLPVKPSHLARKTMPGLRSPSAAWGGGWGWASASGAMSQWRSPTAAASPTSQKLLEPPQAPPLQPRGSTSWQRTPSTKLG